MPGTPPLVVLIHGLASSHRIWEPVLPLLGARVEARPVDLGGGRTIEAEAAELADTIERPATLVGHSLGGLVATALAEARPDLAHGLVLVNSPPTTASRLTASAGAERIARLPVIGALAWALSGDRGRRAGARTALAPGASVPQVLIDDVRRTSHGAFLGSTRAVEAYIDRRSLYDRVAGLEIPVRIVFGMSDQRVDPASLAGYDGLANVTVTRLAGCGHTPSWETPDRLAAAILEAVR